MSEHTQEVIKGATGKRVKLVIEGDEDPLPEPTSASKSKYDSFIPSSSPGKM